MIQHYLKITLRNLTRQKVYGCINISGLAVGITCAILMFLYVEHELGYDSYHENAQRLFRILRKTGNDAEAAPTAFVLAPTLNHEYPDIQAVRFRRDRQPVLISRGDTRFFEKRMFWADARVLELFSFPQIKGDRKTALSDPYTVVITQTTASKYFADADAFGKTLTLRWNDQDHDLLVTGILEDAPSHSHFGFDMLVSFATADAIWPKRILDSWTFTFAQTYVLLPESLSPAQFEARFPDFVAKHLGAGEKADYDQVLSRLQPITDIHLRSEVAGEIEPNGNITYVYSAAMLALFVVLIASFNYMNLATARSATRAKEIGIRKVAGAQRRQLIMQILGESLIQSVCALGISVALANGILPFFNSVIGKELSFNLGTNLTITLVLLGLTLFVGMVSGSYPALVLSAFRPSTVLKGGQGGRSFESNFRKILVISQFAISIILVIATMIVYDQLDYIQNKRLGYQQDQIVVIPHGRRIRERPELPKEQFLAHPNVLKVSVSSHVPSNPLSFVTGAIPEGGNPDGSSDLWPIAMVSVDYDFLESYNLQMIAGRNFSKDFTTDSEEAFILNEAAIRELNWSSPIGKRLEATYRTGSASNPMETRSGRVIGVMKDVHFESLHNKIQPLAFLIKPFWYFYISVKIRPEDVPSTLAFLEKKWQEIVPGYPFEYFFLDEHFAELYETEEAWGIGIGTFAIVAIMVACLGLLGLISFMADRRTKEIGVRKVLGASTTAIVRLLSVDFLKLVLLANLLAWPLAYLSVSRWLQNFAYRVEISWMTVLLSGFGTLIIALLTISFRAVKAALANPVDSLRCE